MLGNSAVLALNSESTGNRQVSMVGSSIVWTAQIKAETKQVGAGGAGFGQDNAGVYVAMFNTGTASSSVISVSLDTIGIIGAFKGTVWNVWDGKEEKPAIITNGILKMSVNTTSVVLLRLAQD